GDLLGEVDQLVGGVPHGGDDDHDLVSGALGRDDALGDALDALRIGHRGATVLLYDKAHRELQTLSCAPGLLTRRRLSRSRTSTGVLRRTGRRAHRIRRAPGCPVRSAWWAQPPPEARAGAAGSFRGRRG